VDVVFLSPAFPADMVRMSCALASVGARVLGVGDTPPAGLLPVLRGALADYLQVPGILDEDDVIERVVAWLGPRRPVRIECNWEVVTMLAARLRERLGVPGRSVDATRGFRDKALMRERVLAAGLSAPGSVRASTVAGVWQAATALRWPLVIKPVAGAGAADTHVARGPDDLHAVLRATRHVPEVVVEEFVTGDEFTYETLSVDGEPVYESVSRYFPNALDARRNEWVSPIIFTHRDPHAPDLMPGVALGRAVQVALGLGSGASHMEWFRRSDGSAVFGEIGCRTPGAAMVDLMNHAGEVDLFRAWAEVVVHGRTSLRSARPWHAASVFKRAQGQGRIRAIEGLDRFRARFGRWIVNVDLLPPGAPRRDWQQTFLSDGSITVRHPDFDECLRMAKIAASEVHLYAG
jgi:biotin carboxylase